MDESIPGFVGWLETPAGRVPGIDAVIRFGDRVGSWKARWGIGRMDYRVPAGLYAMGDPGPDDPVLVTANYKMSYDEVRRNLSGRKAWLLVLDTHGINVWCAAGKGTFGTEELVRRIEANGLCRLVAHRRLLLPMLGAPGVAAHEVTRLSGFRVQYAAIRAADLPQFLDNGFLTTPAMRQLTFSFMERLVLIPVELVGALKQVLPAAALVGIAFAVLAGVGAGAMAAVALVGAMLAGVSGAVLLLPWLPGRSFALKGAIAGLAWFFLFFAISGAIPTGNLWVKAAALLALPGISAFYTLNFTGCTPFTSRSGVKKEMRVALPAIASSLVASLLLLAASKVL